MKKCLLLILGMFFATNLCAGTITIQSAGSGSFDQSLNTTDSVTHKNITASEYFIGNGSKLTGITAEGSSYINFTTNETADIDWEYNLTVNDFTVEDAFLSSAKVDHNTTANWSSLYHTKKDDLNASNLSQGTVPAARLDSSYIDHNTTANYSATRHFLEADINISNTSDVTSAELAGIITNEIGTGLLVYNKTTTLEDLVVVGSFTHNGNVVQNTTSAFNITKATAFPSSEIAGRVGDETGTGLMVFNKTATLEDVVVIGSFTHNGNAVQNTTSAFNITKATAFPSSEFAGVIADETGTGNLVYSTSPTLVTPTLGAATATTLDTGQGAAELYPPDALPLKNQTKGFAVYLFNASCDFPVYKTPKTITMTSIAVKVYGGSVGNITIEEWNATAASLVNLKNAFDVVKETEVIDTSLTNATVTANNWLYFNCTGPTAAGNSTLSCTITYNE